MFILVLIISGLYLLLMWNYLRGWLACSKAQNQVELAPKVTVVIPARNEAANISACLQSIANQTGLAIIPEVIVVDDHSTDATPQIVAALADTLRDKASIKLLHLVDYPETNLTYKKRALIYAISQATTEIIVTTDADCTANPSWLATVSAYFKDTQVTMVAGPVLFAPQHSAFERFQALDFCGTMGLTAAGIHQGWQHLANGANLSFRKNTWQQFGYRSNAQIASGDDMFLIQEVAQAMPGSIRFAKSPEAVVWTHPEPTLVRFVNQRLRWGTKSSAYKEWKTQSALGIAWLISIAIVITGIMAITRGGTNTTTAFFVLITAKAIADFPLLWHTTRFFGQQSLIWWFLPSLFLHVFYVAIIGTLSMIVKRYEWKGRSVN